MTKNYHTLKHEVWLPYKYSVGPVFHRFFEGLKQEKLMGNVCPECKKVYVPARTFCPACYVNMGEWKELAQEGVIVSWVIVNEAHFGMPVDTPFVGALIRIDGTDCNFLHIVGGVDLNDEKTAKKKIRHGARVKTVWRDEKRGHMTDILYFKLL